MHEEPGDDAPKYTRRRRRSLWDHYSGGLENGVAQVTLKEHHVESGEVIPRQLVPHRKVSRNVSKDWFENCSIGVITSGGDSQGNTLLYNFYLFTKIW